MAKRIGSAAVLTAGLLVGTVVTVAPPATAGYSTKRDCWAQSETKDVPTVGTARGVVTYAGIRLEAFYLDNKDLTNPDENCYGLEDAGLAAFQSKWTFKVEVVRSRDGEGHFLPLPSRRDISLVVRYRFQTDIELNVGGTTASTWGFATGLSAAGPTAAATWTSGSTQTWKPATGRFSVAARGGEASSQSRCSVRLSPNRQKFVVECGIGTLPKEYMKYRAPNNSRGGIKTVEVEATLRVSQSRNRYSVAKVYVAMRHHDCGFMEQNGGHC